jgi:hypothetical protein
MPNIDTTTEDEDLRITNAFVATSNALGDAILILKGLEATTFEPAERQELILRRRDLEDDYAANEQRYLAYCDGGGAMRPPSAEDVAAIVQLAGELARMTQKKAQAATVIQLANTVNARFKAISEG